MTYHYCSPNSYSLSDKPGIFRAHPYSCYSMPFLKGLFGDYRLWNKTEEVSSPSHHIGKGRSRLESHCQLLWTSPSTSSYFRMSGCCIYAAWFETISLCCWLYSFLLNKWPWCHRSKSCWTYNFRHFFWSHFSADWATFRIWWVHQTALRSCTQLACE